MTKHIHLKTKKHKAGKAPRCLNALSKRARIFDLLWKLILSKTVLWKIGKKRVKRIGCPKGSKVCAGITCTPCEGAAPPSTPHAFGNAHARPCRWPCSYMLSHISVRLTPMQRVIIKFGAREAGLTVSAYVRAKILADFGEVAGGDYD